MMNRKLLLSINSKILTYFSISFLAVLVLSLTVRVYAMLIMILKINYQGIITETTNPSEKIVRNQTPLKEYL